MVQKIERVSIVGTGNLGTQIAVYAAHSGYEVAAYDPDGKAFFRACEALKARMEGGIEKGALTPGQFQSGVDKIHLYDGPAGALDNADLVIEAVSEDLELKRKVFGQMDALAPPGAILATNSSSLPVSRIETVTGRPEQCLNLHFYQPLMGINMVDIMGGTKTSKEVFQTCREWIRSLGCVPLTVNREIFGFCYNRVWRSVKREILHMWAEGYVDFRDIDRAWMIVNGSGIGPFGRMDLVGLDVVYDIEMSYFNESRDLKDHPPEALKAKIEKNELGVKTGRGFYMYPDPEFGGPDFLKS